MVPSFWAKFWQDSFSTDGLRKQNWCNYLS